MTGENVYYNYKDNFDSGSRSEKNNFGSTGSGSATLLDWQCWAKSLTTILFILTLTRYLCPLFDCRWRDALECSFPPAEMLGKHHEVLFSDQIYIWSMFRHCDMQLLEGVKMAPAQGGWLIQVEPSRFRSRSRHKGPVRRQRKYFFVFWKVKKCPK